MVVFEMRHCSSPVGVKLGYCSFLRRRRRKADIVRRDGRLIRLRLVNLYRHSVEVGICKQLGGLPEINDGEVELVEVLADARAASDDLFEFGDRLDRLI